MNINGSMAIELTEWNLRHIDDFKAPICSGQQGRRRKLKKKSQNEKKCARCKKKYSAVLHLDATVNLRQVSASAGLRICTRVTYNSFDQDSVLGAPLLLRIGIMK